LQGTKKFRERLWPERLEWHNAFSLQVQVKFTQVTAVGFDRVDGETSLDTEMAEISLDQRVQYHRRDDSQSLRSTQ
jgi:hypothetical protein